MTEDKFLEKVEKRARKKLEKKISSGELPVGSVAITDRNNFVLRISTNPNSDTGFEQELPLRALYEERERLDCSVKELVSGHINIICRNLSNDIRSAAQDITDALNDLDDDYIPIEDEPDVSPESPIEEDYDEEDSLPNEEYDDEEPSYDENDGSDVAADDFVNDISNNCGFPINPDYYSLDEFCSEIKPKVAKKLGIKEEDLIVFPASDNRTNESFYKISVLGSEKSVNLNTLYKDYRTSEEDDDKLIKKAVKAIKKELEAEARIQPQPIPEVEELTASKVLSEVLPTLATVRNEDAAKMHFIFGEIHYFIPKDNESEDRIYLTEAMISNLGLTMQAITESAIGNLTEKETTPYSPSQDTNIPNIMLFLDRDDVLSVDKVRMAYDSLDTKENVILCVDSGNPRAIIGSNVPEMLIDGYSVKLSLKEQDNTLVLGPIAEDGKEQDIELE